MKVQFGPWRPAPAQACCADHPDCRQPTRQGDGLAALRPSWADGRRDDQIYLDHPGRWLACSSLAILPGVGAPNRGTSLTNDHCPDYYGWFDLGRRYLTLAWPILYMSRAAAGHALS
jgi:hypothetical protein